MYKAWGRRYSSTHSRPRHQTEVKWSTACQGRLGGLQSPSRRFGEIKFSRAYQESNPDRPARGLGGILERQHGLRILKNISSFALRPTCLPWRRAVTPIRKNHTCTTQWNCSRVLYETFIWRNYIIRGRPEIFILWEFRHSEDTVLPILYTRTWLSLLPHKFTETSADFYFMGVSTFWRHCLTDTVHAYLTQFTTTQIYRNVRKFLPHTRSQIPENNVLRWR